MAEYLSSRASKNFVNATIGSVEMLLTRQALKSLISIEKIRMALYPQESSFHATVPQIPVIYTDIITYNELSFLVRHIPKHKLLIIGGEINAHRRKDVVIYSV